MGKGIIESIFKTVQLPGAVTKLNGTKGDEAPKRGRDNQEKDKDKTTISEQQAREHSAKGECFVSSKRREPKSVKESLVKRKLHTIVWLGSHFPIEGQVTLTSKEGLNETRFSSYLCQPDPVEQSMGVVTDQGVSKLQSKGKRNMRTLNKKRCESSNGRSFLETTDACIVLMHGIAFEDKVHSSEELGTKKIHGARLEGSQKEVVFKVLKSGIEDFFIAKLSFLYEVARIVEFLNPQISRNLWLLHDGWICFLDFGIVGRISPNSRQKIMLDDEDIPHKWYNLIVVLLEPPPSALNLETCQPLKPEDLLPVFPKEPIMTYYKYEGVKSLVTEIDVEQWGSALAFACSLFDLQWHFILSKVPDSPGSLGIAILDAEEMALANADTKYSLGSVFNHVLLHQTIIGKECIKHMAILGETPNIIVGCTGGLSNFAGLSFPFICEKLVGNINHTIRVVEPVACPSLTEDPIHARGLRYHGTVPLISHVYNLGLVEALAIPWIECFQGASLFARLEGLILALEPTHAIAVAIGEGPEILQHP
eukprot:Gb_00832 [translate_table: standard]